MINIELRKHQVDAVNALRDSFRSGKMRPVIQAPTGFGKTAVAAYLCSKYVESGKRVIFSVPRISLVQQTLERFIEYGLQDIGVIQGNHPMTKPAAPIQIASIQTLSRRQHKPHADIVLIDEAHLTFESYYKWMDEWNATPFIGLSATPWAKGMGNHYDDLICTAGLRDLIDQGFLSDYEVFAASHPDMKGVKSRMGDYVESDLMDKMAPLTGDIVTTWQKLGEGRKTFVYAINRQHAKALQIEFEQAGVPTGYIDCKTSLEERERLRRRFESMETPVMVNVGVLTTGIDWDVRCISIARPTRSHMLHVQIDGRGLRTAPGKTDLRILDHSDNHIRLGFPDDIKFDRLNTGTKSESEPSVPLPRLCPTPGCGYLRPPKVVECPKCGYKPKKVVNKLETLEGELIRIKRPSRDLFGEGELLYGQLAWIAMDRGYSPGWASHMFKSEFGRWPTRSEKATNPIKPKKGIVVRVNGRIKAYYKGLKQNKRAGGR